MTCLKLKQTGRAFGLADLGRENYVLCNGICYLFSWFGIWYSVCYILVSCIWYLVFGIWYLVSGIWYLVFGILEAGIRYLLKKNQHGLTFATRQLLLPRFVSRPGHVTGWWGQVCNWDKKNSPFLLHLPRSLHKGRRKNKLKMKLHSFALLCLYL